MVDPVHNLRQLYRIGCLHTVSTVRLEHDQCSTREDRVHLPGHLYFGMFHEDHRLWIPDAPRGVSA